MILGEQREFDLRAEPEHCPGTESELAGKADTCVGCVNQTICEALPKGPDTDLPLINDNLEGIRHKILILSGKGGVGKSTFTNILSRALSADSSIEVGVMDLDICGPSLPQMFGTKSNEIIHQSNSGWEPVWVEDNLGVVSIQFMLPEQDSAIIWRGNKKNMLIKNFLKDVNWGTLDYLVVDTPPGTTDEHLTINKYLKDTKYGIDGALIITTPQEIALLDVRKEINFCFKAGIKILGLIENMSGFVCPNCQNKSNIFKPTTGGGKSLAKEFNIPFLGSIPLDPRIGKSCDMGENFLEEFGDSQVADLILDIVDKIRYSIEDGLD